MQRAGAGESGMCGWRLEGGEWRRGVGGESRLREGGAGREGCRGVWGGRRLEREGEGGV